jgi:hypothetical protein
MRFEVHRAGTVKGPISWDYEATTTKMGIVRHKKRWLQSTTLYGITSKTIVFQIFSVITVNIGGNYAYN